MTVSNGEEVVIRDCNGENIKGVQQLLRKMLKKNNELEEKIQILQNAHMTLAAQFNEFQRQRGIELQMKLGGGPTS